MKATPRTDYEAEIRCLPHQHANQIECVPAALARALERELAESRASTKRLQEAIRGLLEHLPGLWGDLVIEGELDLRMEANAIHDALGLIEGRK